MSPTYHESWRSDYRSWGGTQIADHLVERPASRDAAAAVLAAKRAVAALPFGCGRSYGDVALNPRGTLIDCRDLDRFISFDRQAGILRCEAGVTIADIIALLARPRPGETRWFLPVMPGTRFVTVAGAIANDVHGKNHHRLGTFGRHVLAMEIARTDGMQQTCSPTENSGLYAATIGGLGLTGIILSATLQLRQVSGTALDAEEVRFDNLDEFFALSEQSDAAWEYTAAWVECRASGQQLGRGIFSRANHADGIDAPAPPRSPRVDVPVTPPFSLVNSASVRCFNALYWRKPLARRRAHAARGCGPVLFPLDAIGGWNRLYGPHGFYQLQCVVPAPAMRSIIAEMIKMVAASREGSAFAVLKTFGDVPSPGLLSFPMPGATLTLDFANRGATTLELLGRLTGLAGDAGGRLYPAKDSVMTAEAFRRGFPRADEFRPFIDPGLGSALARRVGLVRATGEST
jgi:FAD/FMN-containing dehydrogenase